jgi:protein-S-isoprenylcysteine O-methyltransferase Ste14
LIRSHPAVAALVVVVFALFVLSRVRADYATRGVLTRSTAVLQFLMFFLHGLSSYSFLGASTATGWRLALSVSLMTVGAIAALGAMGLLRWGDTIGRSVTGLQQAGPYRFSRNPQLIAYFVFLAGYALLYPSWLGWAWLGVYVLIAHMMVLAEERHLRLAYGQVYEDYCRLAPRYIGLPNRVGAKTKNTGRC